MKRSRLSLTFPPERVEDPIIHELITTHGLHVNILRASIDPGKQGRMAVEVTGDDHELAGAFNYLDGIDVGMEPLTESIQHDPDKCMHCTACVPHCPTSAIDVDRDFWKLSFSADQCIMCRSCVDTCPYGAIEIR